MAEQQSSNSPLSLTLLDPDVLRCPICCEPLKIPIFQCENGHLACPPCCGKVQKLCPSCKLPIGYSRCRAMERVIEASRVSCLNAKYGCKEIPSYQNRSSHEKKCIFTPCSCPVRDCNYTSSHKDLKNHVNVEHKRGLILFNWDTPLDIKPSLLSEKITILREEKDGELIAIQGFEGTDGMFVSVSCIAPLATEMRLSCSLGLRTLTNTLKQRFTVKIIQKTSEEKPESGFMLIPFWCR